jgi:hypothetical protein
MLSCLSITDQNQRHKLGIGCTFVILALGRLKQEDGEFEARPCLPKKHITFND